MVLLRGLWTDRWLLLMSAGDLRLRGNTRDHTSQPSSVAWCWGSTHVPIVSRQSYPFLFQGVSESRTVLSPMFCQIRESHENRWNDPMECRAVEFHTLLLHLTWDEESVSSLGLAEWLFKQNKIPWIGVLVGANIASSPLPSDSPRYEQRCPCLAGGEKALNQRIWRYLASFSPCSTFCAVPPVCSVPVSLYPHHILGSTCSPKERAKNESDELLNKTRERGACIYS
jgi:hypothetical protein